MVYDNFTDDEDNYAWVNGSLTLGETGLWGNAVEMSARGDYFQLRNHDSLNHSNFSIAMWVNRTGQCAEDNYCTMFAWNDLGTSFSINWDRAGDTLNIYTYGEDRDWET